MYINSKRISISQPSGEFFPLNSVIKTVLKICFTRNLPLHGSRVRPRVHVACHVSRRRNKFSATESNRNILALACMRGKKERMSPPPIFARLREVSALFFVLARRYLPHVPSPHPRSPTSLRSFESRVHPRTHLFHLHAVARGDSCASRRCLAPWSGGQRSKSPGAFRGENRDVLRHPPSVPLSRYLRSCRDSGCSLRNVPRRAEAAHVPPPRKLTIKGATRRIYLPGGHRNDVVSPRTAPIYGLVN